MRTLITGGSGFVGQAVARVLESEGHAVTIFDSSPPPRAMAQYLRGDIRDAARVNEALLGQEVVIHAAAMLGVQNCFSHPEHVLAVNIEGTANVIASALGAGVSRFVFVSSSEVYGDGNQRPFCETDEPTPKTLYGRTKLEGERELLKLAAGRMGVTIVRLFNGYGPGQRSDFVVPRFLKSALEGTPMQIYGTGNQTRTFTYIDDIARGIVAACLRRDIHSSPGEVFNLGSSETVTILELAKLIKQLTGSLSELVPSAPTDKESGRRMEEEIHYRIPNVTTAAQRLGFRASTDLKNGLSLTLADTRSRLKGDARDGSLSLGGERIPDLARI